MAKLEWIATLDENRARPGSVIRTLLRGADAGTARAVAVTGPGVDVRQIVSLGRDRLELLLMVHYNAPAGWRDILIEFPAEPRRLERAFAVLAPGSGWDGAKGIGSHLI